jgi:uncharacterized damage-inducible protein DinB
MNPQDAKVIANFLCDDFANEISTTERILAAAPEDKLSYAPDAKSKSGLGLLRHLVLEDEWLLNGVVEGAYNPPPHDSDACGILSPADAVARYRERMPAVLDRVRQLSPEQLTRTIDMFGVFQLPAVHFIALALKHSVHHRGQLSAYLRAMGGAVPGIYGPSADTQQAASASAAD